MISKIGIYIWELPYRYGGTESCALKFAWALQKIFPTAKIYFIAEVYNKNDLPEHISFIKRLNNLAGTEIDSSRAFLKPIYCSKKYSLSRKLMYYKIQNSSRNFDLFFYCSRGNFSFKAKKNIAIIHFPVKPIILEKKQEKKFDIPFITFLKDRRYAKSYDLFLPNSKFTEKWLKKIRPDIDKNKIIQMYHPVIQIPNTGEKKEKSILACSRIEKTKKLEALIEAYKASDYLTKNYELWIAGNRDKDDPDYPARLEELCKGYNVKFFISVSHNELVSLYNRATIFWHSKGYGIEENLYPDQMEHFGMTTVEAMSAGCIPVVINKGGQPEIVTPDCGFLWNSLQELTSITENIAKKNESELQKLSKSAILRSKDFNLDDLPNNLLRILNKII